MSLYYQDELVTLWHGDCLEATEWLKADVLITDPPYGIGYVSNFCRSGKVRKYGKTKPIQGDKDQGIRDKILELWDGPALVFGSWKIDRPKNTRHLLIWDKGNTPGMGDLSLPWGPGHEEIYVIGSDWVGPRRSNVYRVPTLSAGSHNRPNHPTPKPIGLMEQLISYSPPGVIADPFAGSGTTLVAASNLGRAAIGYELEEAYCEIIAQRLAAKTLF